MVSVKRFIHDEPLLFKGAQKFVQMFSRVEDPVMCVASQCKSIDSKIAWCILGTALFQDISYFELQRLLQALYAKFPEEKLWTLPVPRGGEIEKIVEKVLGCRTWSLFPHVSGIFWSVGLFVRHHENLAEWLQSRTPEGLWRDLGEIYFMGKHNPRPKACAAIYRFLAPAPMGLGLKTAQSLSSTLQSSPSTSQPTKLPPLPLTMGARRFLAILGPAKDDGFADLAPEAKQKMASEIYGTLAPRNPYTASHALQFFLEQGNEDFICREVTDHCAQCPLFEFCSYGEARG